ncbi:M penetrans family 1 protein [Elizabethkingia meningoseptica]|nr:M penetrans family 1 protein [Elizabethkingia meningoseptica]
MKFNSLKMKKLLGILGILSLLICAFSFIEFHSSMTKVDYNEANGVLKFTTKMNASDLEQALKMDSKNGSFDNAAKNYVNNNFSANVNGSPVRLTYTGSQVNGEAVWVYFEASGVGSISTIKIKNTILLNEFSNQMNLVTVSYKGKQKIMTFQRGKEVNEAAF